ncbi:MAG: hypothetical protein DRJ40_06525 [Thermoprotei archaeon]|nr:MAG: hypothetical protein DRJ40_06525 [Thermoprotei archaeon]
MEETDRVYELLVRGEELVLTRKELALWRTLTLGIGVVFIAESVITYLITKTRGPLQRRTR